jgi:hypothetical protein
LTLHGKSGPATLQLPKPPPPIKVAP